MPLVHVNMQITGILSISYFCHIPMVLVLQLGGH